MILSMSALSMATILPPSITKVLLTTEGPSSLDTPSTTMALSIIMTPLTTRVPSTTTVPSTTMALSLTLLTLIIGAQSITIPAQPSITTGGSTPQVRSTTPVRLSILMVLLPT